MAKFIVHEIFEKDIWESFLSKSNPQTFLQSWNWGETNKIIGKRVTRLGFYNKGKLIGIAQMIREEARRGRHFIIPGGPIIDWKDKQLVAFTLRTLKEISKREHVWFVRVRPDVLSSDSSRLLFSKFGFVYAPMHLHAENTWVLKIDRPEEEILKGMRKTTRYLIRKSLNMGITFESTLDNKGANILKKLQDETVQRHGFVGFSENLFKAQLETFGRDGEAALFFCKWHRKILAAAIIIFYKGIAYYHHSGSTSKYKDIPASYFLQWKIILEAMKRNRYQYNFWGIAPTDDPNHRFAGVTLFKKGFGGERIDWLHAQDLPISRLYWLTYLFETLRRILRRLD